MRFFRLNLFLAGLLVLLSLVLLAGCCDKPGNFGKVKAVVDTVNSFYDPLVAQLGSPGAGFDDKVRLGVVAADTTLALADAIEKMKCASPGQVDQLELQSQAAQKLAGQAGIK